MNALEVTDCVWVDRGLHVKFFYMGLPLPQWFCHGRDCRLTRKTMMQNLPNYIKSEGEQMLTNLEELKEFKFKKKEYSYPMLFDIHFIYVILSYKHTYCYWNSFYCLEFHWTHLCFRPIVEKLPYIILQALCKEILEKNQE